MNQSQVEPGSFLVETLQGVRKEMNTLATHDISAVASNLGKMIGQKVSEDPYRVLATAVGIGFGLGALDMNHVKSAAIRVGKLVAMKAISNMESDTPGEQKGGQDEQQLQLEA